MSGLGTSRFLVELGETMLKREQRYGTSNIQGPAHVLERLKDKMARLVNEIGAGGPGEENDWLDVAGYGSIGWQLQRGEWDGRSKVRRVYLAHSIDGTVRTSFYNAALIAAVERLEKVASVYWPRGAFHGAGGQDDWIWEVNLAAIRGCDALVAWVWERLTPGVSAEMLYAKTLGKTVWLVDGTPAGLPSSSLVGWAADRRFLSLATLTDAIGGENVEVSADSAAP